MNGLRRRIARHQDADEVSGRRMAEVVSAFDHLMDDDIAERTSDSKVALSCEVFTLDELRADEIHLVFRVPVS